MSSDIPTDNSTEEPQNNMESGSYPKSKPQSDHDDFFNDDDREVGDWKSRWSPEAIFQIRIDAIYVGLVFILIFIALILTWRGVIFSFVCEGCDISGQHRFNLFVYTFLGGMLGGTLFGIKYLYKVVARGYWNIDRRLWRIFSPFLSGGLALAIGVLLDSGFLALAPKTTSSTYYFGLGFMSGYFADSAMAKMQEIAETIFGTSEHHRN